MKKITNKEINAALKQFPIWYITVNSYYITVGCQSKQSRDQVKTWVKENLGIDPRSENFVNKSYSVSFHRPQKGE